MKVRVKLLAVAALFIGAFLSTAAVAADKDVSAVFEAAEVARADFAQRLSQERVATWKFASYVANIHNYSIGISESRDAFVVVFLLKQPKGEQISGGGGEYRVDKGSLKVVDFLGYE